MNFKTIVDKDNNFIVIMGDYVNKDYRLGFCKVPELYPLDSTLIGIDNYYHNKLMEQFKELGCHLKEVSISLK
jgi:hypothetical protein